MINNQRALFLDRDGVINLDHGYVFIKKQFEFIDGIFDLCRKAIELHYLIFVITNQAGIGRGYYSAQEFNDLTAWMCAQFLAEEVKIQKVYFCPDHPDYGVGEYKRHSDFRKPDPGMILRAACEYNLDLVSSILIGDKITDIQAGLAAGVDAIFYISKGKVK
jgi:D-glycero-D-manno-heptose 1,7-bisphosphate phosphatase